MISRNRRSCKRDDCDYQRYRKGLCAGHWLEENPPVRPRRTARPKPGPAASRPARRDKAEEITPATKAVVLERCGGRCEACGELLAGRVHYHHRQRRQDGGHAASNVVALHPDCHVVAPQAVHQRPAWARERGLIVPTWADPASTVLVLASGRRVALDDGAAYQPPPDGVLYAA